MKYIILFVILVVALGGDDEAKTDAVEATEPVVEVKSYKRRCFHPYDGSSLQLERLIKGSLKDPDSYQHIGTDILGDHPEIEGAKIIQMDYRAKNSFGGYVADRYYAIQNTEDCRLLGVEQHK